MVTKSVSDKMGIKPGMRSFLWNPPVEAILDMELPPLEEAKNLEGEFDYIHFFVSTQQEFVKQFPVLKSHLKPKGSLWVSWPKARQNGTNLSLPVVIKLGYDIGLAESKTLSINSVWSAIRFTHPILKARRIRIVLDN